ncbi:hypothetical protein NHX12_024172 [Muraenolepis orangiensis]|uniref:Uncharacterized protein n=1 Tax=Muraenolepis orangiensis TaxID=630683 RepID=A0A9Q0IUJ8_9TELE|nr:hypothetical protein NHX12_024172 [Muraenolepis orangiensis]
MEEEEDDSIIRQARGERHETAWDRITFPRALTDLRSHNNDSHRQAPGLLTTGGGRGITHGANDCCSFIH